MTQKSCNKIKIWITGASSGIGYAVAKEFAQRNYQVIASGRNLSALQQLADETQAHIIAFDVTDRQANLQAAQQIQSQYQGVDKIILNAGTCEYINIKQFDSSIFERTIRTNFMSMVYGIEAALPLLRQSKCPHLIGMSSTVAFAGLPRAEAYGASKAAIRNMLEALRIDLLPEKIPVSIIFPGFVKTPLTDRNDFSMPGLISAQAAARYIANGIEKEKEEVLFPAGFALSYRLMANLPSKVYTYLCGKLLKII